MTEKTLNGHYTPEFIVLEVKKDLSSIDALIAHYEGLEFITIFKEKDKVPRSHEERTILDFYKRTLQKRDEVVKYFVTDRPNKPNHTDLEIPEVFKVNFNFPYKDLILTYKGITECQIDFEKLDYRRINPLQHKAFIYNFQSDISEGYCEAISKEIEENLDSDELIEKICQQVASLPIINERSEIFKELKFLYTEKKWHSFYALALPQIEGIFAEMLRLLNKEASGSLRDKVNKLRKVSGIDYFLDYFEFYLPKERNTFSHSGKIDDVEMRSNYLLLDLAFILNRVEELEVSQIQINNIMEYGTSYFKDISRYGHFFELAKKIEDTWLKNKIDNFVKEKLLTECDFELLITNLRLDFDTAADDFERNFGYLSKMYENKEIQFFSLSEQEIKSKEKDLSNLFDKFIMFHEDLKLLIETGTFVSDYLNPKKSFKDFDTNITSMIKAFQKDNDLKLRKIKKLNSSKEIKVYNLYSYEGFIITKDKWKHSRR